MHLIALRIRDLVMRKSQYGYHVIIVCIYDVLSFDVLRP